MFDLPIVCYLFLGGAGGGLGCFAAVAGLTAPPLYAGAAHTKALPSRTVEVYRKSLVGLIGASALILGLGCLCLLVDLGGFNQLVPLLTQPRGSWITFGSYLLPSTILLEVFLWLCWRGYLFKKTWRGRRGTSLCKVLHAVLLILCGSTVVYTGLFLASIKAVPLWHSLWIPVLFVLSSISCGIVLLWVTLIFVNAFTAFKRVLHKTLAVDSIVLLLEVVVLGLLIVHLASEAGDVTATQRAAAQSLSWLMNGTGAAWLFGGLVGLGLLLPCAVEIVLFKRWTISQYGMLFIAVCILIGAFLLRWIVIEAGVPPILFN